MSNQYRIKLEIQLKYKEQGTNQANYLLIIKVLKKDNKFDVKADPNGNYTSYIYTASNEFAISTNSYNFKGEIGPFNFIVPNKKYMNRKIITGFETDNQRKTYLRHLHKALNEWANNWGTFKKNSPAKFKSMGNKWYIWITK